MGQVLSPIELNILIRKRRACNPPCPQDMAANAAKKDKSAEVRMLKAAEWLIPMCLWPLLQKKMNVWHICIQMCRTTRRKIRPARYKYLGGLYGTIVELVNTSPFHGEDSEFEPQWCHHEHIINCFIQHLK